MKHDDDRNAPVQIPCCTEKKFVSLELEMYPPLITPHFILSSRRPEKLEISDQDECYDLNRCGPYDLDQSERLPSQTTTTS